MVVNGRPMKRMKRRVTADLHDFFTFPSSSSSSSSSNVREPFRNNVRQFLSKYALAPPPSSLFPHLMTWQVLLRAGDLVAADANAPDSVICLDVVEEDVARSGSVYCDQCRVVGWSGHPVCGKRYHFIIKGDGTSIGGHKPCILCGNPFHPSESSCRSCNHEMSADDAEEWVVQQLENTTHLLHGVVHSNGFGHLLRVNGREGGSKFLSGSHIMHFWDRLCVALAVRKVSVMDVSKKFGLEYRLLHAITKGHPWYGEWGYEFGAGSFGITKEDYDEAVCVISTLPLSNLTSKGRKPRTRLQDIVLVYQSLSENELVTIRDLFSFLISLIHHIRKDPSRANNDALLRYKQNHCNTTILCPWSRADVEKVEEAMIRVLRAVSGSNWVSWRSLRGAVCRLASPELLDYCLKELGGKPAAGGMVVHARCNPDSGAFEYRLEPASLASSDAASCNNSPVINHPSEECLLRDLKYLYEAVLQPHTMLNNGSHLAADRWKGVAQRILDCKKFVKDYNVEKTLPIANPALFTISCQVVLADQPESGVINPPPEIVVLSPNATVSDLKVEASRAFQDVYLMLRRFQADDLVDYRGVDGSTQVKLLLGSSESVRIQGRCFLKVGLSRFKMERGVENWTVSCSCGIKDDDGERMLACDVCGVWQHTRCSGIHDMEVVPTNFICWGCRSSGHLMRISDDEAKPPVDGNNAPGKGAASISHVM